MTADKQKTERTNKPPVPHKMADKARAHGMTIKEFFFSEVQKHKSINAAALANGMRASSWLFWAKRFGVRSRVSTTVEYFVDEN